MFCVGRDCILALSLLYAGDWDKIYQAIKKRDGDAVEEGLKLLSGIKSNYVTILDPDYPGALYKHCHKPPFVLYYEGDLSIAKEQDKILTVVGSRQPSSYAATKTRELCTAMAEQGYVICSGLARGIDTIAGESSVPFTRRTIAVLGNGINRTYPIENTPLRKKIAANGLVLSEYPNMTPPEAKNFPSRNRILACLSKGTFVAEARPHSGTLITAMFALEYGRDVATLPFAAGEDYANNALIKNGAALVEDLSDLELFMQPRENVKK